MPFSIKDRQVLLAVKGVGPTVLSRLEAMGFHSLQQLADGDLADILRQGASLTGSSCWKNSPQAKAAVQGAIEAAVFHVSQPHPLAQEIEAITPTTRPEQPPQVTPKPSIKKASPDKPGQPSYFKC